MVLTLHTKSLKIYYLLLTLLGLSTITSCDDGDIVVTSFEFDDVSLQSCAGFETDEFVFFKINTSVNEAILLKAIVPGYNETTETNNAIPITIDGLTNEVVYRQFNTAITNSYFCSTVPQSGVRVTNELNGIEGSASITVAIVSEDDNDGVPAEEEDINNNGNLEDDDTDNDGIPNYKDQDDDNDNILTFAELDNGDPDNDSFRDTDDDGTPDYLEKDDDNDGILTINEDVDQNGNPRDDDSNGNDIPNYLDKEDQITVVNNPSQPNTVETVFRTSVNVSGLEFDIEDENFESDSFSFGFKDTTVQIDNQ